MKNALLLTILISNAAIAAEDKPSGYSEQIVAAVNTYRLEHGVQPLIHDNRLEKAGQLWCNMVSQIRILGHDLSVEYWKQDKKWYEVALEVDLDHNGIVTVEDRQRYCGFPTFWGDECGALTPQSSKPKRMVNAWYRSIGHRQSMLNPNLKYAGCARGHGWAGKQVVYLELALPYPDTIEFEFLEFLNFNSVNFDGEQWSHCIKVKHDKQEDFCLCCSL